MQPTTFLSRIDVRYLYFVALALTLKNINCTPISYPHLLKISLRSSQAWIKQSWSSIQSPRLPEVKFKIYIPSGHSLILSTYIDCLWMI